MILCPQSRRALILIVLAFAAAGAAGAGTIVYTFSGDLSGTLGTTPFDNAPFVWTVIADTGGVTSPKSQRYENVGSSSDIDIGGIGDADFTELIAAYIDQRSGHGDVLLADSAVSEEGIGLVDPADVDGWLLATSLGPITGADEFLSMGPLTTSDGDLTITGASNLTFQASVPEPATTGLASIGLGALFLFGFVGRVFNPRPVSSRPR